MNLFDILGPVMVGPSSSHTAGAVRIGWMTQKLLGEQPVEAKILMYGSFAATGKGHGTQGKPRPALYDRLSARSKQYITEGIRKARIIRIQRTKHSASFRVIRA